MSMNILSRGASAGHRTSRGCAGMFLTPEEKTLECVRRDVSLLIAARADGDAATQDAALVRLARLLAISFKTGAERAS